MKRCTMRWLPGIAICSSGALVLLGLHAVPLGEMPVAGKGLLLLSFLGLGTTAVYQLKARPFACHWSVYHFRLSVYAAFSAAAITSLAGALDLFADDRLALKILFVNAILIGMLVVPRCREGSPGRLLKLGDILMLNFIIALVLIEAGLLVASRVSPSRLLYDPTDARSMISAFRIRPHSVAHGFTYSSLGYHDDEFFVADDEDLVITLLADSFGVGIVPYPFNFATIAERELKARLKQSYERIAIHNFGVPSVGMREYFDILKEEALSYEPSQVVLCVYVGNDIDGLTSLSHRDRYLFQDWLFARYIKRFFSIYAIMRDDGKGLGDLYDYLRMKSLGLAVADETPDAQNKRAVPVVPDYIYDWTKEKPHLSYNAFIRWERSRLYIADRASRETLRRYEDFFAALDAFHQLLQDRLLVLIIPDQFQLEDDLWKVLMAEQSHPADFDRDYPQQQIGRHCRTQSINHIDLLPELRAAQARGRTYHLRDTHWNARGNRVAGEALAKWLVERNRQSPGNAHPTPEER